MDLEDEKFGTLSSRLRQLRRFAKEYLSSTSILSILPTGIHTKDQDLIVQVTKNTEEGYRLSTGREELSLNGIVSFANEGAICKLRSVARIENDGKAKIVVPNNFTSLIEIPRWSQDSETFQKNYSAMEIEEDDSIYTSLAQLSSLPLSNF